MAHPDLLITPEGGSLNSVRLTETEFVKSYDGPIERGSQKLRREFLFLTELPPEVAEHFPPVVAFRDFPRERSTELRLKRIRQPALAKAILRGLITPERLQELLIHILAYLVNELYPLRGGLISGEDLYRMYHGARLTRALALLREHPDLDKIVRARKLYVNGFPCPSMQETVAWMGREARTIFHDSRLVAGHGDAHLDNILVAPDGFPHFWLVDPRGEELMPPHYDLAKMLKALRTGYDLIHYGFYEIRVDSDNSEIRIDVRINHGYDDIYRAGLTVAVEFLGHFAEAEGVSIPQFARATQVAEIAHVLSFASYHANRPAGCDVHRVTAYLAVAALLAKEAMQHPYPRWEVPVHL